MGSRDSISAVIVTYNEERNIEECLETARWMDEIIIVDAYSTDMTVELCKNYTNKIFQRPWPGFGKQKNFAIDQANSDWVFILDADERITDELKNEIVDILKGKKSNNITGYRLPRKNYFYGKWIRFAGSYPDYQLRLFRKGSGKLDDFEPHNSFILNGQMGILKAPLIHYTERTIADHFKKYNNFTTLAAKEKQKTKGKVKWYDLFFRPVSTFIKMYFFRQGFKEGIHGLIICIFGSMYTFGKYVKLWEMLQTNKNEAI